MELVDSGRRSGDGGVELAERHRHGDPDAFDELYERHAELVYGLARRLVGPRDAADVAQEIFIRIFRHLGGFRGRSSLKTWVYRVALNHCRSRLRRRRPIDQLEEGEGPGGADSLPDERSGPEKAALARDELRRVEEALASLPRPFREAVVLRDVEGLKYGEIAEVLGVRIGTVRSRIARGRERLRAWMEESS